MLHTIELQRVRHELATKKQQILMGKMNGSMSFKTLG